MFGFDLDPIRGPLVAQHYRNEGLLHRAFGLSDYPHFKTPAAYLKRHAAPDDEIIVRGSREMHSYLGHVDYLVRTAIFATQTSERHGRLLDRYVPTPLIMSADALEKALTVPGRRKWLVAFDALLAQTRRSTKPSSASSDARGGPYHGSCLRARRTFCYPIAILGGRRCGGIRRDAVDVGMLLAQ